jgi:hypothetical protein
LTENLVSFETLRTDLSWLNSRWKLVAAGVELKDFGRRELEAHQALRVIHELRLTQHGTIGSPNPVMEYWLSDGQAPQGTASSLKLVPLETQSLRVEQMQGQWCVRDDQKVLFNFGLREADAQQAVGVIQKYGFNQLGMIGQGAPSMLVLLRQPVAPTTPMHPGGSQFPRTTTPHDLSHPAQAKQSPSAEIQAKYSGAVDTAVTPSVPPLRSVQPQDIVHAHHNVAGPVAIPGLGDLTDRIPFDPRQVQLQRDNKNWKLSIGGHVLADFGSDESAAHLALSAVRYYRFTEQCLVGSPKPYFSYFLVNGQAPQGTLIGVHTEVFQPEMLTVEPIGARWAICANRQPLVQLGERPDDAKKLLEVIQHNKFDRLCRIGAEEGHCMTFFARAR